MFVVEINFPPLSSLFKKTYRSLRHASIELKVSYYFFYNCYHHQHNNQFTRFFTIYRVDENNNQLEYKPPKKKRISNNDLKQFVRKPQNANKRSKKIKTKTKLQVKKTRQDEWVPERRNDRKEHDTNKHVTEKTGCSHWKLWSFGD